MRTPLTVNHHLVRDGIGESDEVVEIIDSAGKSLVQFWNPKDDDVANFKLFAAAPDLLAALKSCDEALCHAEWQTNGKVKAGREIKAARAAIAKATNTKREATPCEE